MKFIFLIKSMLHDWVTIYFKYIVTIVVTMVLSFLAMFFIATKNTTENIEDLFLEKWYNSTYMLYTITDIDEMVVEDFDEKYPDCALKCDHQLMDKYIESGLPMPYSFLNNDLEWSCLTHMYCFKLNGTAFPEFTDFGTYLLSGPLAFDSTQSKYAQIMNQSSFKYDIVAGRDYTEEDLLNHNKVLVVSDETGFSVGDVLTSGGYDFEIIGLLHTDDISTCEYSLIPFWFADECMQNFQGQRNIPLRAEYTFECIEGYDCYTVMNRITFEKPLTNKQLDTLSEVTGLDKSLIVLNYDSELQRQLTSYMRTTYLECIIFGVFCITNIILVMWYLCTKMYPALKIFRVYGAKDRIIIAMIVTLILIVTLVSLILGLLLCPPAFKLYHLINSVYEWRTRCAVSAALALFSVNLIAAIPMAIITVKRSPIAK